MDQIFDDMKDVIFYIYDLLITGNNDKAHLNNIKKVFERILSYGLVPNFAKILFFKNKVSFLGHDIDDKAIHANHDKIEEIINMPEPKSAAEFSTFLGIAGYYRKYLNNFADIADPLYKIVNKERWEWNLEHSRSFNDLKKLISLPPALTYFNPELLIRIATDASKSRLGAVLFHTEKDGKEKPIAFASRTLAKTEINYTNIEREALAIMFAIKRFQEYLLGLNLQSSRTINH
ncbi:unnamed protein product [Gordionus sp. m RMFG-2023]